MLHLRITPVRSASRLQSAANPNALAAEGYTVEDGYVVVDTQAEADRLISQYPNLELDLDAGDGPRDDTPRATMTADGVERTDDHPTNGDGEPLCVGMDDGQCSRTVDEPGGRCWQHD